MKKYKVNFSMTLTNYYEMVVEAENEDDAWDIATNDFDEVEDRIDSECGGDGICNDGIEEIE